MRIAVTGLGAISAAGANVESLLRGLARPERVFERNSRFDLDFEVCLGTVREEWTNDPHPAELENPTGRLCLTAARECVESARKRGAIGAPDGLVLGTSTGGQSNNEKALFALMDNDPPMRFDYRGQGCMAAPTRMVARGLDLRGPVQTVSTACTSSANAIAIGAAWILSGRATRVLAGGGDALCYTTVAGFHILELTGEQMCRPFGEDRPGLTLGEGAGFLMLESFKRVREEGRVPLAELVGWGMSSDAHHMTAPPEDGSGAELAMRRALASAGRDSGEVSYVNAHGTGTKLNDAAEAQAIERLFGPNIPVMSCKGLLGHTLGGAGALEAVVTVLSINEKKIYENIGAHIPAEDCPVRLPPPSGLRLEEDACVISNSFAFGGNNCSLLFGAAGEAR